MHSLLRPTESIGLNNWRRRRRMRRRNGRRKMVVPRAATGYNWQIKIAALLMIH